MAGRFEADYEDTSEEDCEEECEDCARGGGVGGFGRGRVRVVLRGGGDVVVTIVSS